MQESKKRCSDDRTAGCAGMESKERKVTFFFVDFFFLPIFPPAFSLVLVHTVRYNFTLFLTCSGNEKKETGRVTDFYTLVGPIPPRVSINANVFYSASLIIFYFHCFWLLKEKSFDPSMFQPTSGTMNCTIPPSPPLPVRPLVRTICATIP